MTRDDIIRMARDAGAPDWWIGIGTGGEITGPALRWLETVATNAVATEREACAQECSENAAKLESGAGYAALRITEYAIRARAPK